MEAKFSTQLEETIYDMLCLATKENLNQLLMLMRGESHTTAGIVLEAMAERVLAVRRDKGVYK